MSRRTERVASILQNELAMIIMRELNDPRLVGLPSITRVKVSEDVSVADIYVTIMGTEGKQAAALNALKHSAGMMRTKLSQSLEMRQVPYLKFHIDENLKKEREVLEILRKLEIERAEKEAAAGEPPADAAEGEEGESQASAETPPQSPAAGEAPASGDETPQNS